MSSSSSCRSAPNFDRTRVTPIWLRKGREFFAGSLRKSSHPTRSPVEPGTLSRRRGVRDRRNSRAAATRDRTYAAPHFRGPGVSIIFDCDVRILA
jgi:hypothetical protein